MTFNEQKKSLERTSLGRIRFFFSLLSYPGQVQPDPQTLLFDPDSFLVAFIKEK